MLEISTKEVLLGLIAHEENGTERFFLIRRKYQPFRNHWSFPGGGHKNGETLEEGVVREVKEETGLDVDILNLIEMFNGKSKRKYGKQTTVYIFNCQLSEGTNPNNYVVNKEESYEGQWFTAEEINQPNFNIIPRLKKYMVENVAVH